MRILITPDWYPWPEQPLLGVFCREHARAVSRVADVVVLTWRRDDALRVPFRLETATEDGLRTFRVRYAGTRIPRTGLACKLAGSLRALRMLARDHWRPDVIHAHEYGAAPVALALGAAARAPTVLTEHYTGFALGTVPERERRRARWAFEHSRVVCPVSHELAGHLQDLAPRARFEPVPNVVDTETFAPINAARTTATPRLITVASLTPLKGQQHLIAAIARLRADGRDVPLDVVGDGPLRGDLERQVRERGVDDLVCFHGRKDKVDVANALGHADAFVLPSLWENLPCVLLEAMAVGLPTVATRVGGVPEILGPSHGVIVEPGSADALAAGVEELLSTLGGYDRDALRAQAIARFGYDAIAKRWADVYASASTPRPSR
jgi:glycosyltransferase involved in cell wall biosynthesis